MIKVNRGRQLHKEMRFLTLMQNGQDLSTKDMKMRTVVRKELNPIKHNLTQPQNANVLAIYMYMYESMT